MGREVGRVVSKRRLAPVAAAAAAAKAGGAIAAAPAVADGGPHNGLYTVPIQNVTFADNYDQCQPGFGAMLVAYPTFTPLEGCVSWFDVGENPDGRLEVFGLGTDGAIWHDYETIPGDSATKWSGWYSLGSAGGGFKRGPDVLSSLNGENQMWVAAVDVTGDTWKDQQNCPGGCGWSGWYRP